MRRQIRGLSRASVNCQDGVSLVQTADGALSEVHDMLQRLNELAVQASNNTYTVDDRWAIQLEANNVITEINRIAKTTDFNGLPLFDEQEANNQKMQPILDAVASDFGDTFTVIQGDGYVSLQGTSDQIQDFVNQANDSSSDVAKKLNSIYSSLSAMQGKNGNGNYTVYASGSTLRFNFGGVSLDYGVNIQAGVDTDEANSIWVGLETVNANSLNLYSLYNTVKSDKIETYTSPGGTYTTGGGYSGSVSVGGSGATGAGSTSTPTTVTYPASTYTIYPQGFMSAQKSKDALATIDYAIKKVSEVRSHFGAMQNRLEHIISNLDNTVENTDAAESRIRDTDMAEEMMRLSTQSILSQAGTSMLSQTQHNADYILDLLK